MRLKSILMAVLFVAVSAHLAASDETKPAGASADTSPLKEGAYSATVSALPCSACPPQVEKALNSIKGVKSVSVDAKTKMVHFTVEKGATVTEAQLQKTLKAASDEMGMGADYTLHELTRVKT